MIKGTHYVLTSGSIIHDYGCVFGQASLEQYCYTGQTQSFVVMFEYNLPSKRFNRREANFHLVYVFPRFQNLLEKRTMSNFMLAL